MLEGIMVVSAEPTPSAQRATPRIDPELRRARACYDHIAGELGVAIADALVARGAIELSSDDAVVTETGRVLLTRAEVHLEGARGGRRVYCRPCLDWSERRPHLAGVLGALLLERALRSGFVRRCEGSRVQAFSGGTADVLQRLGIG